VIPERGEEEERDGQGPNVARGDYVLFRQDNSAVVGTKRKSGRTVREGVRAIPLARKETCLR